MTDSADSSESPQPQAIAETYDVVVLGGALSGAATATLILRRNPGARVLIIERNEQLTRRVGEATVVCRTTRLPLPCAARALPAVPALLAAKSVLARRPLAVPV